MKRISILFVLACDSGWAADQKWNNSNDKDDGCEGHCGIYWSSGELLDFIQENPQFVAFLQKSQ